MFKKISEYRLKRSQSHKNCSKNSGSKLYRFSSHKMLASTSSASKLSPMHGRHSPISSTQAVSGTGKNTTVPKVHRHHRPRSRNHTLANALPPAVYIKTYDMLNPQERRILEAAEKGDRPTLIACLNQKNVPLNVNAVDAMGRTAVEIAVDNENIEIVELLLQQKGIRIGNALLCAIREGVYTLVEMLVNHPSITKDMLGDGWSKYLDTNETATSEYSSDISPVILAAHLNRFEILAMLLRKDATIEKPHRHSCPCETCDQERLNDSLHYSLKRINSYRALASPAWMSLTSSDPILCAFKLSWDLQKLSVLEDEFKDTYLQLSEQCKQYACDLLSQCRSTEEVIAILNKEDNIHDENIDVWASKLSLSRLKRAIKYEQKMFVSHPHCQQLLTSIWYEGFPVRQQRGSKWNFVICVILIILWPLFAISYIIMPKSRIGRIVRSPFMKFLYYSISFGCFLLLLTMVTFEGYRKKTGEIKGGGHNRAADRGPPPTVIEWLVLIWVVGMLWSEVKQLWDEGLTKYIYQWWNWLDFIMICLYLCTISLRVSAYALYVTNNNGYTLRHVIRTHWDAYEPMLVSEALFAMGNVFSFARIIYLFQTNPYLGPLQISLGCMLIDVAKFCFIFGLIITSFAIGLAQLYWYYDSHTPVCIAPDNCKLAPNPFSSIANSYMTLLWSLFSITKVEDTDVIEDHHFTQWIGRGMFIMYHMTSIIVLLNMLIAMMSHSFQIINDHADLEWKFHRTKLWMAHFDEGSSLPPPFNIIITPKAIYYALCSIGNLVKWLFGRYHHTTSKKRATIRRPGYSRKSKELEQKAAVAAALNNSVSNNNTAPSDINILNNNVNLNTISPNYGINSSGISTSFLTLEGGRRPSTIDPQALASGLAVIPKLPLTYADIIQRLVSRFIHETKKTMKMDGVNEDDLLEIKQDISSLRYELRDDRRKEIVRSSSHIDAVKRDIMRTMSSTKRMFSNPLTNNSIRRTQTARDRVIVSEEEENQNLNYYEDDSDIDIKSQCESVTTDALSSGLPSITVADKEFIFENKHFAFRTNSTKSALKNSSILDSNLSTSTIDFERRRTFNEQNNTIKQDFLVSALKRSKKQKAKNETQNMIQTQAVQKNNETVLLHSALATVEEIRDSLNERLNHLINQINMTTSYIKLEDKSNKKNFPSTKSTQHYAMAQLEPISIVEFADFKLDSEHPKLQQRPHTPLSSKNQSVSPSRVSFSSVQTTFRDED